ncbi:hypothetical protein C8J56DRAFT_787434, partial [Mycena floridula]
VITFANPQSLFSALRDCLKMPDAKFLGSYDLDADELVTDKQRVQMTAHEALYNFCVKFNMQAVWAYLWENWLRPGRWELWARSGHSDIPILKTTMILESHWRRIKKDFLHHFSNPRVDLLVWILVTKLAPTYYRKLDLILHPIPRYRELAAWRKAFKHEWRRCETAPITLPLNEKYRPNPHRWACNCPSLATSRFLICKHLVQGVKRVPPVFFLEVRRQRTAPFWKHKDLVPLNPPTPADITWAAREALADPIETEDPLQPATNNQHPGDDDDSDDETDFRTSQKTFMESMNDRIALLRSFTDGLEYQFNDPRFLATLEREGNKLFRLAENCLDRERRINSAREEAPATYERGTSNAMLWRPRPSAT